MGPSTPRNSSRTAVSVRTRGVGADALSFLDSFRSSAPMGVGLVDRNFRYVCVNDALAAINRPSSQEHIGGAVPKVVPAVWTEIERHYHRVLDNGKAILNVEMSRTTAAEPCRSRHWPMTFYPIRDGEAIVGIGVVVTALTEPKKAQEAQHELTRATRRSACRHRRDPRSGCTGHQRRVTDLSATGAGSLGVHPDTLSGIRLAANIHDITELGVPAEMLSRPGWLRPSEFELLQDYSRPGQEITAEVALPWPVADMILHHHERMDGSGYPAGLGGDDISVRARIIAAADTVEAVASHRPYRAASGGRTRPDRSTSGQDARR
jgi:hypothetical protein